MFIQKKTVTKCMYLYLRGAELYGGSQTNPATPVALQSPSVHQKLPDIRPQCKLDVRGQFTIHVI